MRRIVIVPTRHIHHYACLRPFLHRLDDVESCGIEEERVTAEKALYLRQHGMILIDHLGIDFIKRSFYQLGIQFNRTHLFFSWFA